MEKRKYERRKDLGRREKSLEIANERRKQLDRRTIGDRRDYSTVSYEREHYGSFINDGKVGGLSGN